MLKQYFIISLFIIFIVTGNLSAEDKPLLQNGPIVITSASLSADNRAHTAVFEGSVVAKTENMTLYSDRMTVHYVGQTGNVTRIYAEGKVKLTRDNIIVTANAATYFAEDEKIIFTGEPRAVDNGNIVTGTKMTYLIKEDRSIVENGRVLIENRKGN